MVESLKKGVGGLVGGCPRQNSRPRCRSLVLVMKDIVVVSPGEIDVRVWIYARPLSISSSSGPPPEFPRSVVKRKPAASQPDHPQASSKLSPGVIDLSGRRPGPAAAKPAKAKPTKGLAAGRQDEEAFVG